MGLRSGEKIIAQSYIADVGAASSRKNQVWDVISHQFLSKKMAIGLFFCRNLLNVTLFFNQFTY